jgi:signal transduction histidine kinase
MSKLPDLYKDGFAVMRSSHRLVFIGLLTVIFPILFLVVFNTFLSAARSNTETAEKQLISGFHDTVVAHSAGGFGSDTGQAFLEQAPARLQHVRSLTVYNKIGSDFSVQFSTEETPQTDAGTLQSLFSLSAAGAGESVLLKNHALGAGGWLAVRTIETPTQTIFVVSEHSFELFKQVFQTREQKAYALLSVIFAFLIVLAYWHGRQIDWHAKYNALHATLKERELFDSMIAHEFRTPLTAIRGYNSFLSESPTLSVEEKKYVATIAQSTDRLLALVNDFLEVARLHGGKQSLQLEMVDIQPTILAVVQALTTLAEEKGISLVFHKLAVPVVLNTDQKRLYQIIQNLLSNAIKYTEKGTVEIVCDPLPKSVTLIIKDTGSGISAEDQKRLFAPFSRVGGVEKSGTTGTGLGMWITKQFIEALRGSVSVESIKGVGTHVLITFRR